MMRLIMMLPIAVALSAGSAHAQDVIASSGPLIIHLPSSSERPARPSPQTSGVATPAATPAPDDRATLTSEIDRLRGENAALKKELLSRNVPLPAASPQKTSQVPSDAELDEAMTFLGKAWRRMVLMMADFQRDIRRKD